MEYTTLSVDIKDHIAHITLNRPDSLNTMIPEFWSDIPEAVRAIDASAEARVIVISSTGKHFTAGMDLSVFTSGSLESSVEAGRKLENLRRKVLQLQDSFSALEEVRIPVLVAIQGGCIGGGVDMVSAADCRYITEDGFFSVYETKIGMTADVGTCQRLPKIIPEGMAREMIYTGRRLSAAEALNVGLVNRVFPDHESMLAGVMDVAKEIAANSPLAVAGCKEMVNFSRDHSVADGLKYMANWQSGMFQPDDMMEAFAAKAEKRDAQFSPLCKIESPL
jgi:enoyl-CoA hydratase